MLKNRVIPCLDVKDGRVVKVDGVISGRALYDGRIDVAEAVSALAEER